MNLSTNSVATVLNPLPKVQIAVELPEMAAALDVVACGGKNEDYDFARFALITYVGTPIAVCGLFFNAVLVNVFSKKKRLGTPTFYLFLLAIFDSLICLIYIPFFTVDAFALYFRNESIYHIWNSYAMILYGTSRVVQFASTYMVVCATIERFIVVGNITWLSWVSTEYGRYTTSTMALCLILVLRSLAFFDYKVIYMPECPSFQDYVFEPLLLAREDYFMFNFYLISIVHTIVPFLLLLSLNLLIVLLTKKRIYDHFGRNTNFVDMPQISSLLRKESINSNRKHRSELRYATRTMVTIVFTYLFCNVFNVFITVLENVFKDNPLLLNGDGTSTKFYTYTADLISIMVAINSFLRIFIYFFCNPQFRFQVVTTFRIACRRTRFVFNCDYACRDEEEHEASGALMPPLLPSDTGNKTRNKQDFQGEFGADEGSLGDTCYL